jgi:EAL domain-containing protein (putative c-di-GMP-specific phosphodiesterase class I)
MSLNHVALPGAAGDTGGTGRARLSLVDPVRQEADASGAWRLERLTDGAIRSIALTSLPFRVGRRQELELVLSADSVSKDHACIEARDGVLVLRDLGSRNGTFLNGLRIESPRPLRAGDVIHFADFEFRLASVETRPVERDTTVSLGRERQSHNFVAGTRELRELLNDGAVTAVFQPIVRLPTGEVVGYEALGRGRHPELPESPLELFKIAESIGPRTAAQLSRLFRQRAVELVQDRTDLHTIFLNTHPAEMSLPGMIESLEAVRALAPRLDLALEIHESLLARPSAIAELRQLLAQSNIRLAYDDFGAGQARLLELAEAPPDFLKFDRRFVTGIDSAPPPRRRLLASLTSVAGESLVRTIAEGVETAAEAHICARVGFTHAQGYFFGRPMPVENLPRPHPLE